MEFKDRTGRTIEEGDVLESYIHSTLTITTFKGGTFQKTCCFGVEVSPHCYREDDWKILTEEEIECLENRFSVKFR